jgi:hypothetical protein
MLNPRYEPRQRNGKFWCSHEWLLIEKCGEAWWLGDARHLCRCLKCGKLKTRNISFDPAVPDEMVTDSISYG